MNKRNFMTKPLEPLEHRTRIAVDQCDLEECRRLLEIARAMPVEEAEPIYLQLFSQPRGLKPAYRWVKSDAVEIRINALIAIQASGDAAFLAPLLLALGNGSPAVSSLAHDILISHGESAIPQLIDAVEHASPHNDRKTLLAIQALGKIGGRDGCAALIGVLNRQRQIRNRHRQLLMTTGLNVSVILIEGTFFRWHQRLLLTDFLVGCTFSYLLQLALQGSKVLREAAEMDKAAGEALEQLNDTSAIPGLVAVATGVRPPSARRAAKHALQHLLPLVGSDNTKTLTAEQERGLVQLILQNVRFEPLALTALKSLEFIGTGQSAAFIEKLIRGLDSPNDDLVPSTIRTEAQRLLPMLQERKRNEQQMAVLLRPAEPASQELLLRPAAEVKVDAEIEREQLLRSGE